MKLSHDQLTLEGPTVVVLRYIKICNCNGDKRCHWSISWNMVLS